MKPTLLLLLALLATAQAATTINPVNKYAYGANLGWLDCSGDTNNGAVIGEFVCSGYIYSANAGWISLGGGTPVNGFRYLNNSATDFGVNHDGLGNLNGYAWAANIGWLTFTNRDATGATFEGPKVDLLTGKLSGNIWSANCGWISLSNASAFVQTDRLPAGADTDSDGIPDAWEMMKFGNLTTANLISDFDLDGVSDRNEYLAGTDPLDLNSFLRITALTSSGGGATNQLVWTSVSTRQYRLLQTNNVAAANPWVEIAPGLITPDAGPTTVRTVVGSAASQRFFRVEAIKPIAP